LRIGVAHGTFDGTGGIEKANRALYNEIVGKGHEVHFHTRSERGSGNVLIHPVSSLGGVNSLRAMTFAMNASRQLRSGGFNVTHSHGEIVGADVITAHSCHARGLRVMREFRPKMHVRHQNMGVMDAVRLRIEKKNYREHRFKKAIAISNVVKRELMEEYYVPENDIAVIPHGISERVASGKDQKSLRQQVRDEIGIQSDDFVLLFVSNEPHRKGLEFVLGSMQRIDNKRLCLVVVGKDERNQFKTYAKSLGIAARVFFAGVQSEVERYYAAADLFVLPTLYEPFGLVITEAMCAGIPVLVSSIAGAAQHFIQNGRNGLLLHDPTSTEEISARITELVTSDDLRETLLQGTRNTRIPSWGDCADRVIEVYREVQRDR